ncbi:MAG: ABC transporter substrate-binding protein [Oscillospiraceae bacterium]|jgi:putative aldouronate transport system substrate-binding protein|nr:ABC transporter substrate-binding protein [Oscillospiraceae bacterium]
MSKRIRKLLSTALALTLLLAAAAFAQAENTELEPYHIKWYITGPMPQPGADRVMARVNELLEPINATLEMVSTDFGNYVQKMQLVISAGEPFDLCYTSNWSLPFYATANSGAFLALNDYLETYCPTILETLPSVGWTAASIHGGIYAIPNLQIWAKAEGFVIRKDIADKYGFDVSVLADTYDMATIEPLLAAIQANESPEIIPIGLCAGRGIYSNHNHEEIGGPQLPGVVKLYDDTCTVINQFTDEAFVYTMNLARDWYLKGYVVPDAAVLGDMYAQQKAGLVATTGEGAWKPGGDVVAKQQMGGRDIYDIRVSDPYMTNAMLISTMTAVSATSQNPERALMFYDMIFSSKELYNTITLGMENVDYKFNEDGTASTIPNSGYDVSTYGWEFGNQFNQYVMEGQPLDVWEQTIELNNTAKASPLIGWTFDPEPIAAEIAAVSAVTGEYNRLLLTGSVDPETVYPEFLAKLDAAGAQKIIEEEQRQIDAWKAGQ